MNDQQELLIIKYKISAKCVSIKTNLKSIIKVGNSIEHTEINFNIQNYYKNTLAFQIENEKKVQLTLESAGVIGNWELPILPFINNVNQPKNLFIQQIGFYKVTLRMYYCTLSIGNKKVCKQYEEKSQECSLNTDGVQGRVDFKATIVDNSIYKNKNIYKSKNCIVGDHNNQYFGDQKRRRLRNRKK